MVQTSIPSIVTAGAGTSPLAALWERYSLPLLVFLGTGLRAIGLRRHPFEQDELYTELEARLLFDSPLNPGIEGRPLYYLIQHPFLELWHATHLSLRALPFVFGVLGIIATWHLARRVGGVTAATVATVLVTVSPWHLQASGMARYWSLIYLLAALSYLYLTRSRESDSRSDYIAALTLLLLGTATHPTFVFPMVGFVLSLSFVRNDEGLGWRWPTRNAWIYLWLPYIGALFLAAMLLKSTGNSDAMQNWGSRGPLATARLLGAAVDWSTPVLTAVGGLGALVLSVVREQSPRGRQFALGALLGMLSCLALLVLASGVTSVYADYAIAMLPLLVTSAGCLVAAALDRFSGKAWLFATVAMLVIVTAMAPATASHLSDGTRFDYRPAFAHIAATAPDAPVLTLPIIIQRYYAPELNGVELTMSRHFLDTQLAEAGDLWVIVPVRRYGIWQDHGGALAGWLPANCRLAQSHERPRFDYRIYRADLYRCGAGMTEPS